MAAIEIKKKTIGFNLELFFVLFCFFVKNIYPPTLKQNQFIIALKATLN